VKKRVEESTDAEKKYYAAFTEMASKVEKKFDKTKYRKQPLQMYICAKLMARNARN
jgi:hypothetical protein